MPLGVLVVLLCGYLAAAGRYSLPHPGRLAGLITQFPYLRCIAGTKVNIRDAERDTSAKGGVGGGCGDATGRRQKAAELNTGGRITPVDSWGIDDAGFANRAFDPCYRDRIGCFAVVSGNGRS